MATAGLNQPASAMKNGSISHWLVGPDRPEFPATSVLDRNVSVDVAIVGGGITGLWTAWALKQRDPSMSVAVLEAHFLGFGASGRNGGHMSTKPVGMRHVLKQEPGGADGVRAAERLLQLALDDSVEILGAEKIQAHRGGWLQVARTPSELNRIEHHLEASRAWGLGPDVVTKLSARESNARVNADGVLGALYSPENWSVDPARMVAELARLVQANGVAIFTESPVSTIRPGSVAVGPHRVNAELVVVATEGYTVTQAGQKRSVLPMNSAQIVTERLSDSDWERIGWAEYESFTGAAHGFFYSKRTDDGRIAIGGRGKPYRYGSGFDHDGEVDLGTVRALEAQLSSLFPFVKTRTAHAWCGVMGVPRDWSPFVDFDRRAGILRLGGYTGNGLTASHVAGRIAGDLLTGNESEYTRHPWVTHRSRKWEPEPLRWIGATGLYRAYSWADRLEQRSDKPTTSVVARIADRVAGR